MDLLRHGSAVVFLIENPSIILKETLITISNHEESLSTDISVNLNTTFTNNDCQLNQEAAIRIAGVERGLFHKRRPFKNFSLIIHVNF